MKSQSFEKTEALIFVTRRIGKFPLLIAIFLLAGSVVWAQNDAEIEAVPAPDKEVFESALDLISIRVANKAYENGDFNLVRLYSSDGYLWYKYSLLEESELFYGKQKGLELKLIYPKKFSFFKLRAVSRNWYEVETNSDTKETKFIRIDDSFMKREGINLHIELARYIKFDESQNPIRLAPNGETKTFQKSNNVYYKPTGEFDGDWLQIYILLRDGKNKEFPDSGWIKWKKANDLLVQFVHRQEDLPNSP